MLNIILLSKRGIKKNKFQSVIFLLIVAVAALLLNIGILVWVNYSSNFDKRAKELNSEHVIIAMPALEDSTSVKEYIREDSRTKEYEKEKVKYIYTAFNFSNGDMSVETVLLNANVKRDIGQIEFVEISEIEYERPIYLPYIMKTGGGYQIGDTITLKITGAKDYSYTVAGFFESTFLGSMNISLCGLMLEDEEYQEISEELGQAAEGYLYKIQLSDKEDSTKYTSDLVTFMLDKRTENSFTRIFGYEALKQARTFMPNMIKVIIVAFALVIVIVGLIIVRFNIENSIDEDMRNIGVLKANGYTSKQIILSIINQFGSIVLLACGIGIACSYLILPFLRDLLASQSGILWKQGFDLASAILTSGILLGVTLLTSLLSSRKINRVNPITAIRNGINTHNFKKNHLPLNKTKGNLNLLLALKNLLQNSKQNIMILIIVAAVSFSAVFAGALYLNFSKETNVFSLVVGEVPSVLLQLDGMNLDKDLIEDLKTNEKVEEAIYYSTATINAVGTQVLSYVTDDFSKTNEALCYEGRNPKYENEIAISGLLAKNEKLNLGDSIMMTYGDVKCEFLITGFIQTSNNTGREAELTTEGMQRLNKNFEQNVIYIYLNEGEDIDSFITFLVKEYGDRFFDYMDFAKRIESQMSIYTSACLQICKAILVVMATVVSLIIYLVINMLIVRKRHSLGIMKALGFQSIQLMSQMLFSYFPTIVLATGIGCVAGYFFSSPLFSLILRGVGIMRIRLDMTVLSILMMFIGLCLFNFIMAFAVTVRIRKISPYNMITEE